MDKVNFEKKYKAFRRAQHICFYLSLVSCVLPMVVSSIKVVPTVNDSESRWAFGGVATFFVAIVVLILLRSLVKKFLQNLPCTLTVFISLIAIALFLFCLKKIIDDALAVVVVGACGSFIGVLLEVASIIFKSQADNIKDIYGRMSNV